MDIRLTPSLFFSYTTPSRPDTSPLSLHDALPIWTDALRLDGDIAHTLAQPAAFGGACAVASVECRRLGQSVRDVRSEEHTSELQSRFDLVCRLLLEKKK